MAKDHVMCSAYHEFTLILVVFCSWAWIL